MLLLDNSGGGAETLVTQTSKLVKSFTEEDKEKILSQADVFPSVISAETMIAMKVDLGIPWEKLKKMGR